ncbi:hypothetical protein MCOR23_005102 [Pyricularia oryzae]|nr:hypothetical protein MCOR26_010594 [Pyricularia oryzae]KAI6333644.1 hypothetical protein MCOR28_010423 [Pyricularia oryzae]KAI6355007.1 hypothetical protein MCOR32_010391 [Pyricularia oryzae]KAI6399796.1 hypothetical protein MCOR23_005102 [Pyricularia oryzae]
MANAPRVGEIEFLATACLLASKGSQHAPDKKGAIPETEDVNLFDSEISDNGSIDGDHPASKSIGQGMSGTERRALLNRFLDHVAEIFAREKNPSFGKKGEKTWQTRKKSADGGRINAANHVAAAGMVWKDLQNGPTVFIAKNGGLDDKDCGLLHGLQTWLRLQAVVRSRAPAVDKDKFWAQVLGHNQQRLGVYVSRMASTATATLGGIFCDEGSTAVALELAENCVSLAAANGTFADSEMHTQRLGIITALAYQLRYSTTKDRLSAEMVAARKTISFLGRIRASYEVFRLAAQESELKLNEITVVAVPPAEPTTYPWPEVSRHVSIAASAYGTSPLSTNNLKTVLNVKDGKFTTHCHAEIQIVFAIEESRAEEKHPFIGCSKKSCWLCWQFLTRYRAQRPFECGFYHTRQSHGVVMPRWTASSLALKDEYALLFREAAVVDIMTEMQRLVKCDVNDYKRPPAQAQSSTNTTIYGSRMRAKALAKQRMREARAPDKDDDQEDFPRLKDRVYTRQCMRIICDGAAATELVSVDFYKRPVGNPNPEFGTSIPVPNLSAYYGAFWPGMGSTLLDATDQTEESTNGSYLILWSTDPAMEPNKTIMKWLGIASVPLFAPFWHGDVFVLRYIEDPKTRQASVLDCPAHLLDGEMIRLTLQQLHSSEELLIRHEREQELEFTMQKWDADKALLRERLTPTERRLVDREPGLIDMLAMTQCDDGATIPGGMKPEGVDMVEIRTWKKKTALDIMGWEGFSSDHL